jgi:sulfite reductase (ferredoxin)
MRLVDEEKAALSYQTIEIDTTDFDVAPETLLEVPKVTIEDTAALKLGKIKCSKQAGYYAIGIKVLLGDFILIRQEY